MAKPTRDAMTVGALMWRPRHISAEVCGRGPLRLWLRRAESIRDRDATYIKRRRCACPRVDGAGVSAVAVAPRTDGVPHLDPPGRQNGLRDLLCSGPGAPKSPPTDAHAASGGAAAARGTLRLDSGAVLDPRVGTLRPLPVPTRHVPDARASDVLSDCETHHRRDMDKCAEG